MQLIFKISDGIRRVRCYETFDYFIVEEIAPIGLFNFTSKFHTMPKAGFIIEDYDLKYFKDTVIKLLKEFHDG